MLRGRVDYDFDRILCEASSVKYPVYSIQSEAFSVKWIPVLQRILARTKKGVIQEAQVALPTSLDVERIWHTQDSPGQIAALAFRKQGPRNLSCRSLCQRVDILTREWSLDCSGWRREPRSLLHMAIRLLGVPLCGREGVCDLVLTLGIAADGGANQEAGDPRGARRASSHSRCRADMAH